MAEQQTVGLLMGFRLELPAILFAECFAVWRKLLSFVPKRSANAERLRLDSRQVARASFSLYFVGFSAFAKDTFVLVSCAPTLEDVSSILEFPHVLCSGDWWTT